MVTHANAQGNEGIHDSYLFNMLRKLSEEKTLALFPLFFMPVMAHRNVPVQTSVSTCVSAVTDAGSCQCGQIVGMSWSHIGYNWLQ